MRTKKSWREKLADDKDLPRVATIDGNLSKRWGTGSFVIPAPREVDELMRRVPRGKLTTIRELRAALASRHSATIACPITTGIFAWIAAHAADEAEREGVRRVTPYWRTLKTGGELNAKYPGGADAMRAKLEAEGHRVIEKGRRYFVEQYERRVVEVTD
jgi:alkylated DNA nucleotide flippase Atl1